MQVGIRFALVAIAELFNSAEGPAFEQIVNSSDWNCSESVTVENKNILIDTRQQLCVAGKRSMPFERDYNF